MAFNVSDEGVNNTEGTSAQFNGGGSIRVGGNFINTGEVKIDIRAELLVLGNIVNSRTFNIKDYVVEGQYELLGRAINDLTGDAQNYLRSSYQDLKKGNVASANRLSVQIVLGLFKK